MDTAIWPIGLLALLLVLVTLPGGWAILALAGWGGAALGAWLSSVLQASGARRLLLYGNILAYLLSVALFTLGPAFAGGALAPLAVLGLFALLPRHNTTHAASDWAAGLVAVAWAVVGVLALLGLRAIPQTLSSAAVPVIGALLAYFAGRRAGAMQGFSTRVSTGIGITLAVAGCLALSDAGQTIAAVLGAACGITLSQLSPAPPRPMYAGAAALVEVQHMVVFAAPITFGILWTARTFF